MFSTLFLFNSLSELVEAEIIFLGEGSAYQIEPVPSHITSECGMCIATQEENTEIMSGLLTAQGIEHSIVSKENQ